MGKDGYMNLAFSGVLNAEHGERIRSGNFSSLSRGSKFEENGNITPTFSGSLVLSTGRKSELAHMWAKMAT